ncbi:ACR DUF711 containing protein [Nitzschia inconspicua]|uniref:ACR DUF711 containing protein n=1 Tax=Nitzschia inconspicua TaxID=303405 RepID=A0A9K3LJP1_9STRA|nr:ACR DUF711 containing protein [Nitzschia inconspicua]
MSKSGIDDGSVPSSSHQLPTIRTITAFVALFPSDFQDGIDYELSSFPMLEAKLTPIFHGLKELERTYQQAGYTVQTLRLATNPFGEWLVETSADECFVLQKRLNALDDILSRHGIFACGVGPAKSLNELACCRQIVGTSDKFSCSFMLPNCNDEYAEKAAQTIYDISTLDPKGLTNFQFCVASKTCRPWIPFFPIAYHEVDELDRGDSTTPMVRFAIGLENGPLVRRLLQDCQSIRHLDTIFRHGYTQALLQVQEIARTFSAVTAVTPDDPKTAIEKLDSDFQEVLFGTVLPSMYPEVAADLEKSGYNVHRNHAFPNNDHNSSNNNNNNNSMYDSCHFRFAGIDTSINPSLDENTGSVASAMECLAQVRRFGGPGTMAAAAAITQIIQSLEGIQRTGYCGLMLPVCEDRRLAELASSAAPSLNIVHLLNISSVCGVGVDTVPIPGHTIDGHEDAISNLQSLLLDVIGLAERWNKPLTCRVFPVPGMRQGEVTDFSDSPYLVDSAIFSLEY